MKKQNTNQRKKFLTVTAFPLKKRDFEGHKKRIQKLQQKVLLSLFTEMSEIESRRIIREIMLWSYAETMEQGQIKSFVSGESNITMRKLNETLFRVTYEPVNATGSPVSVNYLWNVSENKWNKL